MSAFTNLCVFTLFVFLFFLLDEPRVLSQVNQPISRTINIIGKASDPLTKMPFDPSPVNLPIGSTVMWINNDAVLHTVTSFTNSFDSGIIPPKGNFNYTFYETGYYNYYCRLHPNMNGVIAIG